MDALVVPADPTEPVRVIDLDSGAGQLDNLQKAVGGFVEVQANSERDLWIHDEGRINDSPVNVRASHWVLNDSQMAKEGRAGEWSVLYGDVVVTGPPDREGDSTAVDPKLVAYFSDLELSQDAVADWDVRNVQVIVTEWRNMGRDYGDDRGLGL
jgi:hypothetical protein